MDAAGMNGGVNQGSGGARWWRVASMAAALLASVVGLAACGGGGGGGGAPDGGGTPVPVVAPTISAQPSAVQVTAGQVAVFSVQAAGTAPLAYQWLRDGAAIAGATQPSWSFIAAGADNGALFTVQVSNSAGSVTSTAARLSVNAPPAAPLVLTQPAAVTVQVGQSATFSVTAEGSAPLTYQWQRDGVPVAGATSASWTLPSASLADNGAAFNVVVSNAVGSVASAGAVLSVQPVVVAPTISAAPQAQSVQEGTSATLSVAASGTAPFIYRWRRNGVPIDGASAATYTTPPLALGDSAVQWSVEVSNSAGTVTSSAVQVTVLPVPAAITAGPQVQGVTAGQTARFSVTATGSAPLSYQWRRNGVDIAGATAATYTTPATTQNDDGALFSVEVNNAAGTAVVSAAVRLTVAAAPVAPSFTAAPVGVRVTEGQSASFSVSVSGTAPITLQWLRNGVAVPGATGPTLVLDAVTLADDGARFSVRAGNAVDQVTSGEAVLAVDARASVLAGRSWAAAQPLESNTRGVIARAQGIDDQGRATMLFLQSDGTRNVLYATRGTPGAGSTPPSWTAPQAIDLAGGTPFSNLTASNPEFGLYVAPGGNALAFWVSTGPCTPVSYNTAGTCRVLVAARFLVAGGGWEAPFIVGEVPGGEMGMGINDRGDMIGLVPGWVRSGTDGHVVYPSAVWKANGGPIQRHVFEDASLSGSRRIAFDNLGNVLVVSQAANGGITDIVAYRGTLAAGMGPRQVLDILDTSATLQSVAMGLNGQQVVVWTQATATGTGWFATTARTPTADWSGLQLTDLGDAPPVGLQLTVDDAGDAVMVHRTAGWHKRWVAGQWQPRRAMPEGTPTASTLQCSHARNGNFVCLANSPLGFDSDSGMWFSWDAASNTLVQRRDLVSPGPGFVLGFNAAGLNLGLSSPRLSLSGQAVVSLLNRYSVLPTPAAPAGTPSEPLNLWGLFMR